MSDEGNLLFMLGDDEVVAQQTVEYLGDELLILLTRTGELYLSLASVCAALGLNIRGQTQRIGRTKNLVSGLRLLPIETRGGVQRINCLLLSKLTAWAIGIQVRGQTRHLQAKVEAYQRGVAEQRLVELLANNSSTRPIEVEVMVVESTAESVPLELPVTQQLLPLTEGALEQDPQLELRTLLAQLPQIKLTSTLAITSYQEDRAIREASLAREADWQEEPGHHRMRFVTSNRISVYVSDPDTPFDVADALERIRALGETTVLTGRILIGLWNIHRSEGRLAKDGTAPIRLEDILEWRGVQKHSRTLYPGSEKRSTDGYQWKHRQQVHQDIKLLEQYYLRGQHTVVVKGRARKFLIDGPYLRVTSVRETTNEEEGEVVGYFIAPGGWINTYEEHGNLFLANIDRRIFQLNPQNDQIALRIALYLTEYWRQQARTGDFDEPIVMEDLLSASMVAVDKANFTSRFIPRVEAALQKLKTQGIIQDAWPLRQVDRMKPHWGREWLATRWRITPPVEQVPGRPLPPAPRLLKKGQTAAEGEEEA